MANYASDNRSIKFSCKGVARIFPAGRGWVREVYLGFSLGSEPGFLGIFMVKIRKMAGGQEIPLTPRRPFSWAQGRLRKQKTFPRHRSLENWLRQNCQVAILSEMSFPLLCVPPLPHKIQHISESICGQNFFWGVILVYKLFSFFSSPKRYILVTHANRN